MWQVVSRSLVAYLANAAPEAALKLRPDDPRALLKLAERHFKGHVPSAGPPGSDGQLIPFHPTGFGSGPSWRLPAIRLAPAPCASWKLRIDRVKARPSALCRPQRASVHESVAGLGSCKKYDQRDYDAALYFADALLQDRSQALPASCRRWRRENPAAKEKLKAPRQEPALASTVSALPKAVSDALARATAERSRAAALRPKRIFAIISTSSWSTSFTSLPTTRGYSFSA